MSKTALLAALTIFLLLGACQPELPPAYYAAPAPPPLQPYLGPPLAAAPTVMKRRFVRHHYAKKRVHRRVHCRCIPPPSSPPAVPPAPKP